MKNLTEELQTWYRVDLRVLDYFHADRDGYTNCLKEGCCDGCEIRLAVFLDWGKTIRYISYAINEAEEEIFIEEVTSKEVEKTLPQFNKMINLYIEELSDFPLM